MHSFQFKPMALAALTAFAFAPAAAQARVFFGGGVVVGAPGYYYPPYYGYPYDYAPYGYAPAYAPAPVVRQPPQAPYCREYSHSTAINGVMQQVYGTACQQPDGTWRMMN